MKGQQHPTNEVTINPSGNESILDVISRANMSRRHFVRTGISATTLAALGGVTMGGIVQTVDAAPILDSSAKGFGGIGFDSIPPSLAPVADAVAVPPGYSVEVLASWGDPIMPGAPEWSEDATQDAASQSAQFGMHNDGMHFFPLTWKGRHSSRRGLLCVNHEYTHEEILHGADGQTGGAGMTIEKARKSQAALGVSVLDIVKHRGQWKVNRRSPFARRITGNTRMRVSGPAAGHPLMRSEKFDITPLGSVPAGTNDGFTAYGTLNNCANGYTPWGTYLTCEENWNGYFAAPTGGAAIGDTLADQKAAIIKGFNRYGVLTTPIGTLWPQVDPRFNADTNPLEPNLFGWVVEIDPFDPDGTPVKRTALGRMKHEGAQVAVSQEHRGAAHRVAFYMGDDERNEYVYKFVCDRPFKPGHRRANRDLLDDGTLYVAKFTSDPGKTHGTFRGAWIPLVPSTRTVFDDPNVPGRKLRLREVADFSAATDAEVQALILIKTRQAADAVGATMMDRPEWVALRTYDQRKTNGHVWNRLRDRWVDDDDSHDDWDHRDWGRDDHYDAYPVYNNTYPLELYCTLTNNNRRGGGGSTPVTSSNNPDGSTAAASARPAVDGANPRPDNDFGHIMRWREDGHVVTAVGFEWDLFVLCGDSITTKTLGSTGGAYVPTDLSDGTVGYIGNIVDIPDGSADFGAPDGVWFDQFGRLWIQTDQAGDGAGDWINIGANMMACADPNTKEIKRFLTSPRNCEVTGITSTPDGRTLFVGIQHPGEGSPPSNPTQFSNWPQGQFAVNSAGELFPNTPGSRRPRASVIVITRVDGGIVGD